MSVTSSISDMSSVSSDMDTSPPDYTPYGSDTGSYPAEAAAAAMFPTTCRSRPHTQIRKRNARERRRVETVNNAFSRLRHIIPYENRGKRLSKVKTLRRAIDYINQLRTVLHATPGDALAAASHVTMMTSQRSPMISPSEREPSPGAEAAERLHQTAAYPGTGPAYNGTGPAYSGTGPAYTSIDQAYSGSGPAYTGTGPAHLSGPAHPGSPIYFNNQISPDCPYPESLSRPLCLPPPFAPHHHVTPYASDVTTPTAHGPAPYGVHNMYYHHGVNNYNMAPVL